MPVSYKPTYVVEDGVRYYYGASPSFQPDGFFLAAPIYDRRSLAPISAEEKAEIEEERRQRRANEKLRVLKGIMKSLKTALKPTPSSTPLPPTPISARPALRPLITATRVAIPSRTSPSSSPSIADAGLPSTISLKAINYSRPLPRSTCELLTAESKEKRETASSTVFHSHIKTNYLRSIDSSTSLSSAASFHSFRSSRANSTHPITPTPLRSNPSSASIASSRSDLLFFLSSSSSSLPSLASSASSSSSTLLNMTPSSSYYSIPVILITSPPTSPRNLDIPSFQPAEPEKKLKSSTLLRKEPMTGIAWGTRAKAKA